MVFGAPLKKPSCILQAVCPYCDIRLLGSTPHAVQVVKSNMKKNRRELEVFNLATLVISMRPALIGQQAQSKFLRLMLRRCG
jgi:hypothetical protein